MHYLQIVLLIGMLGCSNGLICFNCTAGSLADCQTTGVFVDCPSHTEVCATSYYNTNGEVQIVKQCKEIDSCLSDEQQNWSNGSPNRCNSDGDSECHCCCFTDWCGKENECQPASLATTCPEFPSDLPHGQMNCSDSFNVGSVCEFSCSEDGYELNPSAYNQLTCLPNGKWNKPKPCCSKPCPPNIRVDLVSMVHRKYQDDYTTSGIPKFLQRITHDHDNGLRFARVRFSGDVHRPLLFFNHTAELSGLDILDVLQKHHTGGNEDEYVNIGHALTQVFYQWVLAPPRPHVPKVIVLHTDSNSDDKVSDIAKTLREFGVTFFPYYWQHGNGSLVPDEQQMFDIAGYKGPFIRPLGTSELHIAADFFNRYCPYLCDGYENPK